MSMDPSPGNFGYGVIARRDRSPDYPPRSTTVLALDDLGRCGSLRAFRSLCVASESARDLPPTTGFAEPKKR